MSTGWPTTGHEWDELARWRLAVAQGDTILGFRDWMREELVGEQ